MARAVKRLRQTLGLRLTRWSARRHGVDTLPLTVGRRRIYIVPTRFGLALSLLLVAMLLAGLNYNSNLGLAFGFLVTSLTLVTMHHCHRNLLGLQVDAHTETDAFAGGTARFEFRLHNHARIERYDIEIHVADAAATANVAAHAESRACVDLAAGPRGLTQVERFELRTRHPFGWFRAWTYVHTPLTAFVAPQPTGERRLPTLTDGAGLAAPGELNGDEDFHGLRAYEAGMPLKHMAWKVLARGGAAAVRSYVNPAGQPEWLDFAALAPQSVEARLAQLCRWVLEGEAAGRVYGLRLPGAELAPARGAAHRTACLRALAACGVTPDLKRAQDSR